MLPVAPVRWIYPILLRRWDGGAVKIDGTVSEGDEVAGFKVIHFPGHAPGLIGLWRESDRVALVSDIVYLVDSARLKPLPEGEASVPHPAWAWDHQQAKESVRKLAALDPAVVCAGHAEPLRGENLRATLEERPRSTEGGRFVERGLRPRSSPRPGAATRPDRRCGSRPAP